ncbi:MULTISPECIES: hypothetical protein, partial [Rhodoplanes]|uniref:hypothetical protein n=1 Tax=Rhodoplanes TaxID=29407 RepID=UPI0013ECCF3C
LERLTAERDALRAALKTIEAPLVGTPIGDPWAFYADLQAVARDALAGQTEPAAVHCVELHPDDASPGSGSGSGRTLIAIGRWRCGEILAFGHHRLVVDQADGAKIACVYGPSSAANARLIAAAPETAAERDRLADRVRQLEYVIKCTREVIIGHFDDGCDECANAVALIDLALAKAEGRSDG